MNAPTYTVLFLCQENSARSLMAEAMLNKYGKGRFQAYSAGISPAAEPNPIAIKLLQQEGFATDYLIPKHYRVFLEDDAPSLDFVFTLCASSEQEAKLNIWDEFSSDTITAHWHFNDPSTLGIDEETEREALMRVQLEISQRIRMFMMLPDEKLERLAHFHDPHN